MFQYEVAGEIGKHPPILARRLLYNGKKRNRQYDALHPM